MPLIETSAGQTPGSLMLIVTPTLGTSPYLDDTVESIRALDLPKLAILVCPEGKIAELQTRYPDFRVVRDAGREGGIYGALNAGIAAASEPWDWFTYINDDDLLTPGFAVMARRHCRPENQETVAYGDIGLIDHAGRSLGRMTIESAPKYFSALLQGGISPAGQQGMLFGAAVVRALGGYRTQFRLCADLDFWARAHAAGRAFHYCGSMVGKFRIQAGQLSGDIHLTRRELQSIVNEHYPAPVSWWGRRFARLRYRLCNAPRYFERWRAVGGWRSSEEMLERGSTAAAPASSL